ncbi:MAG: 4'-phosphopantetheinyl transferase superfamily protein [Magnetococcales bacterium]|nr:4'-phosphopantetheinyl transferase superfamily protein [Magnetococcales bacterium]
MVTPDCEQVQQQSHSWVGQRPDALSCWIWQLDLDELRLDEDQLSGWLSVHEKERAGRLSNRILRERFLKSRYILRGVLALCLACKPSDIYFLLNKNGKPALDGVDSKGLRFNLSHSGSRMVLAVGQDVALGVDVEGIRDVTDILRLGKRFFTLEEFQQLQSWPQEHREQAFLACWTRKEAVVKAFGAVMWQWMGHFQVNIDPHASPRIIDSDSTLPDLSQCRLYPLTGMTPAIGVLAAQKKLVHVCYQPVMSWMAQFDHACL